MIDLRSTLTLPHGLASLNNIELYYIVSKLFGLGGFGEHFIEKERLYLCFEKENYVRFLFISTLPIISEAQTEPETTIYYGQFDEEFEDIEIYGGAVPFTYFSGDKRYIGDGYNISQLLKDSEKHCVKPIDLVEGLLGIITNTDIRTREPNDAFLLSRRVNVPDFRKVHLSLFAHLDLNENAYRDFSGTYFLIAEPLQPFDSELDLRGSLVTKFILEDDAGFKFEYSSHPIGEHKMKTIEDKFSSPQLDLMITK